MKDGAAGSQWSAQCLALGTGLDVRQTYLSGKSQLPDPKIALPGWYFVPSMEREREDFRNTGILIYTLGFRLEFSFLGGDAESRISCFSPCTSHPSSDCSPLWQVHMQWSCSAGCSSGVLPLSRTSWNIHFAFSETNDIFAICVHRGPDALFRRGSRAGRAWYSLFTFQWE